ncbi:MAG: RNA 2'-phosphotransferase [Lachnospiraceae bacterium]|nr:RNA 2'-phosphotransferase [Lachnospiraceae bacterium]
MPVDVELEETVPPECLYHGTGEKYTSSIEEQGLIPKSRLYVHLSGDTETAKKAGSRHAKPVIYIVKSGEMHRDGIVFYRFVNGVWLAKAVPVTYLERKIALRLFINHDRCRRI